MKSVAVLLGAIGPLLASGAYAQGFNVDVGMTNGPPSAAFGGAADMPGVWNSLSGNPGMSYLDDLNGNTTNVMLSFVGASNHDSWINDSLTSGDDEKLLDDYSLIYDAGFGSIWAISGLAPGNYTLYAYAMRPGNPSTVTRVDVAPSLEQLQYVGGGWTGSYIPGVTHAVFHVTTSGQIYVTLRHAVYGYAAFNGFQLKPDNYIGTGVIRCEPGVAGAMACPCSNPPSGTARGCNNTYNTGGARIVGSGFPDLVVDTLGLIATSLIPQTTSIVLQGTSYQAGGQVFGQGVRCAAGTLERLYTELASSTGGLTAPPPGGPTISARSAALGDPILSGQFRWYFVYYRAVPMSGSCPATNSFNSTTTFEVHWH